MSSRRAFLASAAAVPALFPLVAAPRPAAAQDGTPTGGGADRAAVMAALPAITELAEAAVADGDVPGLALAVVYQDEVVLSEAFGVCSTETGEPVTPDTVFQIASMSKPIASTVVSAVVGTGAATWDDRILDHLPTFRLADPWATRELTITDFMSHRTGLGGDAGGDLERIGYNRDQIFDRLRYLALVSSPRSRYAYSNHGLTVGSVAAAAALDMTWEEASAELLYAPLGMTSTSSFYADFVAATNRADLHVWRDDAWHPDHMFDPNAQSPAGGVSSTVNDLTHWMRLVLADGMFDGEELIPAAALLAARVPMMSRGTGPSGRPSFYGRGWNISFDSEGHVTLGHAGAFSVGARTAVSLHPSQQLGIVTLANAFPTGVPDALNDGFFDLVAHGSLSRNWLDVWNPIYTGIIDASAAAGEAVATPPADPAPALPAGAYTGVFANDYVGPVEISEEGDALTLSMGPEPRTYPLTHFNRDTFTYLVDPEPPAARTVATFIIGPDDLAEAVVLNYFAGNDQQMFPRVSMD